MASAAKTKIGMLYTNARKGEEFRAALQELNHPQPPTPIMTENTTADGIINDTIKKHRLRAIDMRFYWLKDCCKQGHFQVYWKPRNKNLGDYHTTHHPVTHHKDVRKEFVHSEVNTM
eukprot:10050235-Ditylum_brightwellii.AAC.2